ncbi:transaldolase [Lachnospiraceae bacterium]|nr:transaldolase [Lachnospiraceae bacterium]
MNIDDLKVAIYADGADISGMIEMHKKSYIKGFTTNPTLMKKAGVTDYIEFAQNVVREIPDMPISFEVFADDFETMKKEAILLAEFGENVFVKIPITNSKGNSSIELISDLSKAGVNLNITAIFTTEQARRVLEVLEDGTQNIISVFAGRIADTGVDPEVIMKQVAEMCRRRSGTMSLWASCREIFNIMQAERCKVDIITVTNDLLEKLENIGKDLESFSLETVQMFVRDGKSLGFSITSI